MLAATVFTLVNEERVRCGVQILRLSPQLTAAASAHASDMAAFRYFSHTGRDGRGPGIRITRTGYTSGALSYALAENIAMGWTTAAEIVQGWLDSPGHRLNMLNDEFMDTGIAVVENETNRYWVQVFGTRS